MNYKKIYCLTIGFFSFTSLSLFAQCWQKVLTKNDKTFAITTDGYLYACGNNYKGQLGFGVNDSIYLSFERVGSDSDWQDISVGYFHTLALKKNGSLWSFGRNFYGQLGDSTTIDRNVPIQIGKEMDWNFICAGYTQSFAIKKDGGLWGWGYNNFYELGDSIKNIRLYPTQIGLDTNWKMISSYYSHSLGLKKDSSLWAWGDNYYSQNGDSSKKDSKTIKRIGNLKNWIYISDGSTHSLGIQKDGTLWGWGRNSLGQLGDSSYIDKLVPTRIGTDTDWKTVHTGEFHSFGIKNSNKLFAWGLNLHGQYGNGTTIDDNFPSIVGLRDNKWKDVSGGYSYSVGIKSDNTLWSWGTTNNGALGDGTPYQRLIPVIIKCNETKLHTNNFIDKIKIFPNPTNQEYVLIENNLDETLNLEILNMSGVLLLTQKINPNLNKINLEHISKGIYIFKLIGSNLIETKFIINQ